jgi:hypothetical protein
MSGLVQCVEPEKMLSSPGADSMQTAGREPLPKAPLPGVVRPQRTRCGSRGCRCARGELHGPYYYRFWREGSRLRKAYVRPEHLEEVRARCEARRQARRELKAFWETWRQLLAAVRELEQT